MKSKVQFGLHFVIILCITLLLAWSSQVNFVFGLLGAFLGLCEIVVLLIGEHQDQKKSKPVKTETEVTK